MIEAKPLRSALFLPASNPRAIEKARTLPADAVILDLEDAVAPEMKDSARAAAAEAFSSAGFGQRTMVLRVNGLDTPWGLADLKAATQMPVDAVLAPKVNGPQDIDMLDAELADAPASLGLWVMIETCLAIGQLQAIADRAPHGRLRGFVVGTNDLALELRARVTSDRAGMMPYLALALAAARSRGLIALDGVCNDFADLDRFRAEAAQGLAMGFDGKTLIHPAQIAPCNAVFSPTADEIAGARAIADAFALPDHAGKGVIRLDGRMVERLHLKEAERVLAMAAAIG